MSKPPRVSCSSCACGGVPKLIFACSGSSDVGEIADRGRCQGQRLASFAGPAARKLSKAGAAKMYCLAGIGGKVSGIVATTKASPAVLVIDGCKLGCGKRTLEAAGFKRFAHIQLGDLGMAKGESPVTEARITKVAAKGKALIGKTCCGGGK